MLWPTERFGTQEIYLQVNRDFLRERVYATKYSANCVEISSSGCPGFQALSRALCTNRTTCTVTKMSLSLSSFDDSAPWGAPMQEEDDVVTAAIKKEKTIK